MTTCEEASQWVPRALMRDLGPAEEQALNAHLRECPACAAEQALYLDALSQVRALSDSPVPRHFFVYPKEHGSSVREFVRGLTPGWKLAWAFATITLTILVVASRVQFRAQAGIYTFSFGRPLPAVTPLKDQAVQIEMLRAELTELLETRSRTERAASTNMLRREITESNRYSAKQQQRWNAELANLEARLNDRIEGSAMTLTAGMRQSASDLFRVLQRQRQQDMELTRSRFEHLATRGELKEQETDEILSTLLQVARLTEK